jgi:hypothetical protein
MKKLEKRQSKEELIRILEKKKKKTRIMKFPTKSGRIEKRECKILNYVIHRQGNAPHKYFVLDLLQLSWDKEKARKKELRLGYYILGKRKKVFNKWVWGQYAPLIPLRDLRILLHKAKNKGLI